MEPELGPKVPLATGAAPSTFCDGRAWAARGFAMLRLMQRLPQFTHVPLLATEPSPARTRLAEAGSRSKAMNPTS